MAKSVVSWYSIPGIPYIVSNILSEPRANYFVSWVCMGQDAQNVALAPMAWKIGCNAEIQIAGADSIHACSYVSWCHWCLSLFRCKIDPRWCLLMLEFNFPLRFGSLRTCSKSWRKTSLVQHMSGPNAVCQTISKHHIPTCNCLSQILSRCNHSAFGAFGLQVIQKNKSKSICNL